MFHKTTNEIKNFAKRYKNDYAKILNDIKAFDKIAIFRHIRPDYDAYGSQLGLATWIKDNFPNKEVICLGDDHPIFVPRVYPFMDRVNEEWFKGKTLAIIVDVGKKSRVADPRFASCKKLIVIDHHPKEEDLGDFSLINDKIAAASELVANMLLSFKGKFILSKETATYLYTGIVGDTGNFKYPSTNVHTFQIASELVKTGININKTVMNMFHKIANELDIEKYILETYKVSEHGVAYYVLPNSKLIEFNISVEQGKDNVNIFQNIEGINAWMSITEDVTDKVWRVSIRSMDTPINKVANKYKGGGHANASGATLSSLGELDNLVKDLDSLFVK